ncbi:hypothetical protein FGKAn22_13880 [Ferrigenium kumadai]|uniref:Secretion system X translation initiation factor n=1 Tax=Ferrigenium kumadai TaxID=1682490 RepID=A0AAN1VZS9_9PROT|nr:hypothetical protein [Ferrigenium kumadai]BBI99695.1 hypothetical protein FGKAn22_13880 [Ferrigenium kumadai]
MKQHSWIRLALLIVAAASIAMTSANDDGSAAVKTAKPATPRAGGAGAMHFPAEGSEKNTAAQELRVELERLARPEPAQEGGQQVAEGENSGIFSVTSWYVPPPPPPAQPPPPPPKPTAPPLPFSYLGRYQESQSQIIMLVKGDRVYTVSAGEVIENTYRVEGVVDGRVELTYLPLNIRQTIETGEAS